jgi:hypothetical protein
MSTIIDSLVIQLGLDPTKFNQGQRQAVQSLKQLEDDARRHGQGAERAMGNLADAISSVRGGILKLGAAVIGAASFEQLVVQTVTNTAAMGRFGSVLGVSTELLSKWQNVGKIVTGTTAGMAEAVGGAVKQFAQFAILGPNGAVPFLNALNIDLRKFVDNRGELKDVTGYFLALSEAFYKMRNQPGQVALFADNLGLPQNLTEVLIKGPDAVRKMLRDVEALGPATAKDAAEAQKVVEAWGRAQVAVQPITRALSLFGAEWMVTFANGLVNLAKILQHPTSNIKLSDFIQPGSLLDIYRGRVNALHPELSGGLPTKTGAGSQSVGVAALARGIYANVPGIKQFTSFDDDFHKGKKSGHNEDRAFDFTLANGTNESYADAAAKVRAYLQSRGIEATVLDEANNPSPGATGKHLHVQFNSADAAQRYANSSQAAGASSTSSAHTETNIGEINVNMGNTSDPQSVANSILDAVDRRQKAAAAAYATR